jgi:hypothetical protein
MQKSLSLVLIILLFVVLGCSQLTGKKEEVPTPVPSTDSTSTSDKPANDDKPATDTSSSDSGSSADLSIDKFNKIELDMDYDQVKGIMGSDGDETSSSKSGSYESKSYQWKGDKFASVNVRFQNGKLVSKSQANLTERNGTAELTQDKFNKVNTGMSYDEVKAALGSDGEMSRISKIGNSTSTSYTWKGPKYERVFATFKDDKLTNKTQSGLK